MTIHYRDRRHPGRGACGDRVPDNLLTDTLSAVTCRECADVSRLKINRRSA